MKENNNGWQVKSLGEVTKVKSGYAFKSEDYLERGIKLVRIGNLNGSSLEFGGETVFVDEKYLSACSEFSLKENDVLIAMSGATTGKLALVKKEDLPCLLNQRVGIISISYHQNLDAKYLFYYLVKGDLRKKVLKLAGGSAQPNISPAQIMSIKIPLPPLPIQKQIAEILEKADQAKQKRKEANKLTDEFLQSVFIEMFGDPVKNPKGWEVKKFGDVFSSIRYGTGSPPAYVESGIPFIRATNIKNNSIVKNELVFISREDADKIKKCELKEGNLIVVRSGVNTGDAAVIPKEFDAAYAAYDLIIELEKIHSVFYSFLINSSYGKAIIGPLSRRAGQPHLNAEQLREIEFYFPPKSLQQQFAEIVNKTESLKEKQKQSEQELENLFQSLMQKAFKGELVS